MNTYLVTLVTTIGNRGRKITEQWIILADSYAEAGNKAAFMSPDATVKDVVRIADHMRVSVS